MQLVRCSIDGVRPKEVPATIFWAWRDQEGNRHAYRQRLCLMHFMTNVEPLLRESDDERLHCAGCHIDVEDSYEPVYGSAFMKGIGRREISVALCGACTIQVRANAESGSEELPDREVGAAMPAPTYSAWETLRALGRDEHV